MPGLIQTISFQAENVRNYSSSSKVAHLPIPPQSQNLNPLSSSVDPAINKLKKWQSWHKHVDLEGPSKYGDAFSTSNRGQAGKSHSNSKVGTRPDAKVTKNNVTQNKYNAWPAGPRQFQRKVEDALCHPTLPMMSLYPHIAFGASAPASSPLAHEANDSNSAHYSKELPSLAAATEEMQTLASQLTTRAPKLSATMISNVFYAIGKAQDKARIASSTWTKVQREEAMQMQMELTKMHLQPALLSLLAHFVRQVKPANGGAGGAIKGTGTGNASLMQVSKRYNLSIPERNVMTCVQHVCHGLQCAGVRWEDLGHLGNGLLEVITSPTALYTTRKWDLDHTLAILGKIGLSWYRIPQRDAICAAYVQLLKEPLDSDVQVQTAFNPNSSINTNNSSALSSGEKTAQSKKVYSKDTFKRRTSEVFDTLNGFAQVGLSLRPDEMPVGLIEAIYGRVVAELPTMPGWRLAQLVDLIARMSARGMHKLPPTVQSAIFSRLAETHHDLTPCRIFTIKQKRETMDFGALELLRGLGMCGSDVWESISMPQREMMLRLAEKATGIVPGEGNTVKKQFQPGFNLAVTLQALARCGLRLDVRQAESPTAVHRRLLGMALRSELMDANSLSMFLVSLARILEMNSGNDQMYASHVPLTVNAHPVHAAKLQSLFRFHFPRMESHLEHQEYSQQHVANLLWALGTLDAPWNALPARLQKLVHSGLSREYSAADVHLPTDPQEIEDITAFEHPHAFVATASDESGRLPPSSVLGKLSTQSLDSSMGSVSSFRDLLYPHSGNLSQASIYNWLGALVRSQVPIRELPPTFVSTLLVALTDDLPNQGPATVVQMCEFLSRLNFRVKTTEEPTTAMSGEHLPHFLASALLQQLSKRLYSADPMHLLKAISALTGLHGSALANQLPDIECDDVNFALSTSICQSLTKALSVHLELAHAWKGNVASTLNAPRPTTLYSPGQLLELIAAVQGLAFLMNSNTRVNEVGELHASLLRTLSSVAMTDSEMLHMLNVSGEQRENDPGAGLRALQIARLCAYLGMEHDLAIGILKNLDLFDAYQQGQRMHVHALPAMSPAHELSSLAAFPKLMSDAEHVAVRLLRTVGLALPEM